MSHLILCRLLDHLILVWCPYVLQPVNVGVVGYLVVLGAALVVLVLYLPGMSGTAISLLWAGNGNYFYFPRERDKIGKGNLMNFCQKYLLF